jgi:hypothetical protein
MLLSAPKKRARTNSNEIEPMDDSSPGPGNWEEGRAVEPAENAPLSNTMKRLMDYHSLLKELAKKLEQMNWDMKKLPLPISRELFMHFDREQKEMKQAMDSADRDLNYLLDTTILEPNEMHLLLRLQIELPLQMKQLELYMQELHTYQGDNAQPA